jgi:hypothetical protein
MKVLDQLLVRRGFFECVQILAVQVLYECSLQARYIISSLHDGRYGLQPGTPSRSASSLPGDEFETVINLAHEDRLNNTDTLNGVDKRGQRLLIEVRTGLMLIRLDLRKWNISKNRSRLPSGSRRNEGSESASKSTSLN